MIGKQGKHAYLSITSSTVFKGRSSVISITSPSESYKSERKALLMPAGVLGKRTMCRAKKLEFSTFVLQTHINLDRIHNLCNSIWFFYVFFALPNCICIWLFPQNMKTFFKFTVVFKILKYIQNAFILHFRHFRSNLTV